MLPSTADLAEVYRAKLPLTFVASTLRPDWTAASSAFSGNSPFRPSSGSNDSAIPASLNIYSIQIAPKEPQRAGSDFFVFQIAHWYLETPSALLLAELSIYGFLLDIYHFSLC